MKKYILLTSFILFGSILFAQQGFTGTIIGGFNVSQIDGDRLFGYNKFGFNAGGRVGAILNDRWQLSFEMAFSQRGSSRTRNDDPSSIFSRIKLNYLETPVMVHFLDWKLHFTAGLAYNRLVDFTVIDQFGADITDLQNYRRNNAAVILGASYFRDEHWGFELRWSYSFFDLLAGINQGRRWNEKWISFRTVYKI